MSCEMNRPRLQAYLDGILARDDEEGVERHLAGCEACRTEKERLEKVMEAVGGLTPLKAPAGFKKAFMERLTQGQKTEAPEREPPAFPRFRRMIPLSLAASFIIVGLTAYLVYFSQKGDGGRVPAIDHESRSCEEPSGLVSPSPPAEASVSLEASASPDCALLPLPIVFPRQTHSDSIPSCWVMPAELPYY